MGCCSSSSKHAQDDEKDKHRPKKASTRESLKVLAKVRRHSISKDYEIDASKVVGTGFAGPVLLAYSKTKKKFCAVKSYDKLSQTSKKYDMLKCEVEIYLRMDHPHICRLFNVYEDDKMIHLVMEYCSGGELYHRLLQRQTYAERDASDSVNQMLKAVNYLHTRANVVHRDLKLENWLYSSRSDDSPLKLIDFGFAKMWDENLGTMQQDCGSLLYCAPEVINRNYTNKCDLWSIGVLSFMLLSGEAPFFSRRDGQGDVEVMEKIRKGDYSLTRHTWKSVSETAKDFVRKLLHVNPETRLTALEAMQHPFIKDREGKDGNNSLDVGIVANLREYACATHLKRAALCMMAYALTSDDIEGLNQAFESLDADQSGTISMQEFVDVMRQNLVISNDEVTRLFEVMDGTQCGELTYTSFVAALINQRIHMHQDLVREAFDQFDVRRTGKITVQDLTQVLGDEFEGVSVSDILAEAGITDVSKKTEIDYDTFLQIIGCASTTKPDDDAAVAREKRSASLALGKTLDRKMSESKSRSNSMQRARAGSGCRPSQDKRAFGQGNGAMQQTPEMLEFEAKLRKNGVDVSLYGQGEAKTVQDLFWEVQKGECVMGMDKGEFKRMLTVLRIEVWAGTERGTRMLMQRDVQLQDGRIRKGLNKRIAKKMGVGENVDDALDRCLGSELGLNPDWVAKHLKREKKDESSNERDSQGYPGLKTKYKFHNIYMRVNDPNHADCTQIGLPGGDDFETEELSVLGTDRKHFWGWGVESDLTTSSDGKRISVSTATTVRRDSALADLITTNTEGVKAQSEEKDLPKDNQV